MRARGNAGRHLLWLGLLLAGLGLLLGGGLPVLRAVAAQPPASPVALPPSVGPGGSPVSDPYNRIQGGLLNDLFAGGTATYIVVLADQADTRNTLNNWADKGQFVYSRRTALAASSQAGILTYLDTQQQAGHVTAYDSLWIINAIVVTSDASVLDYLANLPGIGSIWPDGPVWALGAPGMGGGLPGVLPGVEHNIAALGAPQAWALGVRGAGVTVASLDTGVEVGHPALARKYRGWNGGALLNDYNWWDAVHGQTGGPYDDAGNGSHAMGLVLGAPADGSHAIGVAPDARWIAVKMLDETGKGTDAQALRAMQWVLAPTRLDGTGPRPDLRPQVVSNAWGGVCADAVTRGAVSAWTDAGIFAPFAAGDNATLTAPAAFPEAFAVGAVDDRSGFVAAFSGGGPSCYGASPRPQILAPGVDIRSSVAGRYSDGWSGTALAQAHVAGVAALLLSARPDLTVAQVRAALTSTAAFAGYMGSRPNNDYGWGLVDALAAVQAVRPPGSPTPPPSDTPTPRPPSPTLTTLPTPGPAPGCTALFDDVPSNHWAFGYVRWFFCRGYVTGFGDNRFGPDQATSRAQFAKMIVLSHNWPLVTPRTPTFSDVPRDFWAYSFIETAHAHGVVSGYDDGTFQPISNITRVQMAKILVQSQGWAAVAPAVPSFADVNAGHWAYPWVETLVRRRVVSGYGDGTFRPDQKVTRAQLSKMLYLTLIQP